MTVHTAINGVCSLLTNMLICNNCKSHEVSGCAAVKWAFQYNTVVSRFLSVVIMSNELRDARPVFIQESNIWLDGLVEVLNNRNVSSRKYLK